jgi:hypothetical protein
MPQMAVMPDDLHVPRSVRPLEHASLSNEPADAAAPPPASATLPQLTAAHISCSRGLADWLSANLEIETRGLKNPRTFDTSGLPLHRDAQTIILERLHLDPGDHNLLRDDITVIDHALTAPWTVTKTYRHDPNPRPVWVPEACAEGNPFVRIGGRAYYVSQDGRLMPVSKGEPPPDLSFFKGAK